MADALVLAYHPVFRLPNEVLCEIFILIRLAQEKPDQPWMHPAKWDITWIRLSHVCRHWRTAALNEPNLWINPPLWNPTWTQIMLRRSKMATLPRILVDPLNMEVDVVASVLKHVARISDLTVCRTHPEDLERVLAVLPSAVPKLERLSINCRKRNTGFDDDIFYIVTPLMQDTYIDLTHTNESAFSQAPKLRRLELSGIVLNWGPELCNAVESFTLSDIPFDLYPRLQLRSILEAMPNLTSLRLADACPSSSLSQYAGPPLPLVHLEAVSVGPTILQAIYLLEIVTISSAKSVHARLDAERFIIQRAHIHRLLAAMRRAFPPAIISNPATLYERLSINDHYIDVRLGISRVCNADHADRLRDVHSETLQLSLFNTYGGHGEADSLNCFFQSFDAFLLFEIDLDIGPNKPTWGVLGARFRTTLSGIRSVVLPCHSMSDFVNVLSSNTNPASTLVLPALQHIRLRHCNLDGKLESRACRNATENLRKLIIRRRERGTPLTSLRISGCFIFPTTYALSFKEIVDHVVWDEAGADAGFSDYKPYEHI